MVHTILHKAQESRQFHKPFTEVINKQLMTVAFVSSRPSMLPEADTVDGRGETKLTVSCGGSH